MLLHALILCFFVCSIDSYMAAYRNTVVQEFDGCRTSYSVRWPATEPLHVCRGLAIVTYTHCADVNCPRTAWLDLNA